MKTTVTVGTTAVSCNLAPIANQSTKLFLVTNMSNHEIFYTHSVEATTTDCASLGAKGDTVAIPYNPEIDYLSFKSESADCKVIVESW